MDQLSFNGQEVTQNLKLCHSNFGQLASDNYGMLEDFDCTLCLTPTHNLVDHLRLVRYKSVIKVNVKLEAIRKELVVLNRLVLFSQKATYRHAVTRQTFLRQVHEKKDMKRTRDIQRETMASKKAKFITPERPDFSTLTISQDDEDQFST